jgi:hypothetical protein
MFTHAYLETKPEVVLDEDYSRVKIFSLKNSIVDFMLVDVGFLMQGAKITVRPINQQIGIACRNDSFKQDAPSRQRVNNTKTASLPNIVFLLPSIRSHF